MIADGTCSLRVLNRKAGFTFPLDGPKTINGLLLEQLEDIPEAGTSLLIADHPVEILQVQNRMVKVVKILPAVVRATHADEAQRAAELFAGPRLERLYLREFQDGFMPFNGADIKSFFEELKQTVSPDLVLTHHRRDAHQDHRLLSELTWNTFRNHFILEYEIPKYDGDMGQPSIFMPLDREVCEKKVEYLLDAFRSQHSKAWFQKSTFQAIMRLRGMEANAPSSYAEAFYCRKLLL